MRLLKHTDGAKVFIQHITQTFPHLVWRVIAWSSLNALLTGLGILLIIPLLALTDLDVPSQTTDWLKLPADWSSAVQLSFVLGLYFALVSLSVWINRKAMLSSMSLVQQYVKTLRDDLFGHIFHSDLSDVLSASQSRYVSLFSVEINRISVGVQGLIGLITTILVTLPQLMIAFYLSSWLTLYVLLGGLLLFFGLYRSMRHVRQLGFTLQLLNRDLQQAVQDQLNGLKEIKSYGAETQHIADFDHTTAEIQQNLVSYTAQQTKADSLYKIGASFLISLFLGIGLLAFQQEVASLLVVLLIFSRLWPAFSSAQRHVQSVLTAIPSFEVYEQTIRRLHSNEEQDSIPISFEQKLQVEHVSHRYDATRGYALNDVNVTIEAGTTVAITGQSGSGKSTLVDVLMQFIEPECGQIRVDGRPLQRKDWGEWFKSIAYIPQQPYLFYGTIEDNIRKWHPGLTEVALHRAIEMAEATFVYDLPEGIQTRIGDFGHSLSGGERQRIVLARALAKHPSLLILDEATGAIDERQERIIFETLERLKGEMTILYITHRREIAALADQVIRLEGGRIVERGERYETI